MEPYKKWQIFHVCLKFHHWFFIEMPLGGGMFPSKYLNILKSPYYAYNGREFDLVFPTMHCTVQDSKGSGRINNSVIILATPY